MATTFEEFGLRAELLDAVEDADYPAPTALQSAAIPVLRRGSNVVLTASAGAGVVACYGLSVLDRILEEIAEDDGDEHTTDELKLRALVLAPTDEVVRRVAESLGQFAGIAGLRVLALAPGWAAARGSADLVIATPAAAEDAVGHSVLKLDGVLTMVLDSADLLFTGAEEAIESVTAAVPAAAQKVVVTGAVTDPVGDYIERHVRRAMRIPPGTGRDSAATRDSGARRRGGRTSSTEQQQQEAGGATVVHTLVVESRKLDMVANLLEVQHGPTPVLFCRTPARAAELAESLAVRGFAIGRPGDSGVEASIAPVGGDLPQDDVEFAISYDVPADRETLEHRHADGGLVLVEPRELGHLERIADWAGVSLTRRPEPVPGSSIGEIERRRDAVRAVIEAEDLAPHMLLLEPLFERFGAAEVAAALNVLLRDASTSPRVGPGAARGASRGGQTALEPDSTAGSATSSAGMRPGASAPPKPQPKGWLRLFVTAGRKDQLRAGDLVGAITGEADIEGDKIGRIDISETHSIVEIGADVADRVIEALNGTTVKGRSVRVDYDRGKRGGRPSRSGSGGPGKGKRR